MVLQRIIDFGITDDNTFEQNKQIKIINTISLYGSIVCIIFIVATFPFKIILYTLISSLCVVILMMNFLLNKYRKYDAAKSILLFVMPIIIISFSIFIGPIGNEYYLLAELVFMFFLYKKTLSRIFVFFYLVSAFIFIQFATSQGFITLVSPALKILYYPNLITAFILMFIGLDLFYNEHTRYQSLVENQNEALKKNNTEIEERKNDLEKINAVKNKLLSVLSHDLRGPFKSLLAIIDMFDNDYITDEQFKAQLPNLNEKINNTFNMTENLLEWTRSQLKGIKPKKVKFDLTESVHDVVQLFDENISTKKININIKSTQNCTITSDKEMINTILRNIIHNAIKFSFPSGNIDISLKTNENSTRIIIKDEGQGMEPDIVGAFNKNKEIVSKLGTSGEKGSGLGLSIIKEFVELLEGEVSIQSTPGNGSMFTINLPT